MNLLRLLLFAILAYFIIKLVQIIGRGRSSPGHGPGGSGPRGDRPGPPVNPSDIRDASFEDITPEKRERDGGAAPPHP
jgi:hypothetical protein